VIVTDKRSGKTGTRLIIETNAIQANALCGSFKIKGDKLIVSPKKTKYDYAFAQYYREQGFSVPLQIPIIEIL
jgi:hypothetical protein